MVLEKKGTRTKSLDLWKKHVEQKYFYKQSQGSQMAVFKDLDYNLGHQIMYNQTN